MSITFSKLGLKTINDTETILINNNEVKVKQYLPQSDKVDLLVYVFDNSIDSNNFTFSPIRVETYFSIAVVKYYTDITFTKTQLEDNILKTYDLLESNGVIAQVFEAIPQEEMSFLRDCLQSTMKDVTTYNNSFAGMIDIITRNTQDGDKKLSELIEKVKNKEGIEVLSEIKNIVG